MLKIVVAGTTALFLTASPIAHAQTSQTSSAAPERLNAADRNTLTDMRIDLVKAALQLTPDQEKYWPAVESAIRARAEDRKARKNNSCTLLNWVDLNQRVGLRLDKKPTARALPPSH